jgi:hypothetical protein
MQARRREHKISTNIEALRQTMRVNAGREENRIQTDKMTA